jgi:hypothetical protein
MTLKQFVIKGRASRQTSPKCHLCLHAEPQARHSVADKTGATDRHTARARLYDEFRWSQLQRLVVT